MTELANKENIPQIMAWDTTDNSAADLKDVLDISDFTERGPEVSISGCTLKPPVKPTAWGEEAYYGIRHLHAARVLRALQDSCQDRVEWCRQATSLSSSPSAWFLLPYSH